MKTLQYPLFRQIKNNIHETEMKEVFNVLVSLTIIYLNLTLTYFRI